MGAGPTRARPSGIEPARTCLIDGFAVEDGWIYLPDGSLLATTRQTRVAG